MRIQRLALLHGVTLAAFACAPLCALAQDEPPTVEEIVSTGAFLTRPADKSALPITVISADEIADSPTMSDLIRSLNEVGPTQGEFNGFDSSGEGQASIGLRNLGPGRTLVLFNGRRLADEPQGSALTGGGFQNVNVIPRSAVQRIEILKGAGAATYGADAAGGAVNFITRKNVSGFQTRVDYRFIDGSRGDYAADILWGRRGRWGNVLVAFEYSERAPLEVNERDFARRPLLQNPKSVLGVPAFNGWDSESSPGAYIFQTAGNAAANLVGGATALPVNTPFQAVRPAGTGINAFNATGALAISPNGVIRDPNCAALGGYGGFGNATLAAPQCYLRANETRFLVEETHAYHLFVEANLRFSDRLALTSSLLYARQERPEIHLGASQNLSRFPCTPLAEGAPLNPALGGAGAPAVLRSVNNNCVRNQTLAAEGVTTAGASGVGFYSASGANPAVLDFMRRYDVITQTGATLDVFREDQVRRVAGLNPVTGAYDPAAAPGRVQLLNENWRPFGVGGNPAFDENQETASSTFATWRLTETLKGDLGRVLGADLDFEASATYSYDVAHQQDRGILVDRLQRALNGFATNLDDPDGDRCTAGETAGSRTFGSAGVSPTTSVAFTSGAGGGAGAVVPGWVGAGNGCYFLNPFSSAVARNLFSGGLNTIGRDAGAGEPGQVGFAGGPAAGGTAGDYQGYAPGFGLANAPGIVRWLYEDRRQRIASDFLLVDLIVNGRTGFNLPGGAVEFAAGSQYRLTERRSLYGALNDLSDHPCTFALAGAGNPDDIPASPNSTCVYGSGGLFTDARLSGRPGKSRAPVIAGFAEASLPLHDNVFASIAGRYEVAQTPRGDISAFIPAGSARWQITDRVALRASGGETFGSLTPPEASRVVTTSTTPFGAAAPLALPAELVASANLDLQPEKGTNFNVGLVYSGAGIAASLDYFTVEISGRPTALDAIDIARAITGNVDGALAAADPIDCSLAATRALTEVSHDLLGGRPSVLLQNGANPCAAGGATLSGAGGSPLSISYLTQINSGAQKAAGLDGSVTWRVPGQVFDGVLVLRANATWNLVWSQGQGRFFGTPVGLPAYDGLASTNLDAYRGKSTLGQNTIFRGGAGFNYIRGRQTFSWMTRFVSGAADDRDYEYGRVGALATLAAQLNYNPADPRLCAGRHIIDPGPADPLGAPGVGIRPYDPACNVTSTAGMRIPGTFNTDVNWRLRMRDRTTLSVGINNLFDAEPPFMRLPIAFNSYGALTAVGRSVRVGLNRNF